MEIYTMTRPSMPLTAACAPFALSPVPAAALAVAAPAARWASMPARAASPVVLAAAQAQVSREHQVQTQAELAGAVLLIDGINGTNGFKGTKVSTDSKRYTDGGSGVPPRGRPV